MFKPGTMNFEKKNRFVALEHKESLINIIFNILKSYLYNFEGFFICLFCTGN